MFACMSQSVCDHWAMVMLPNIVLMKIKTNKHETLRKKRILERKEREENKGREKGKRKIEEEE